MRKDTTKKFLMTEDRYLDKMLSKGVFTFISRKKINRGKNQISYDVIDFRNVFSTNEFTKLNKNNFLALKNIVEKNGKRVEFNMIYCKGNKSHTDFLLGETKVTQELYELVMDYNPSYFKGKKDSSQRPVEDVTWYDAIMFCNKLSVLLDKNLYYEIKDIEYHNDSKSIKNAKVKANEDANGFRLPLEQEWNYAAKAGTNNLYAGTNDPNKLEEYAWFEKNSNKETHPVATKKPNEWGFYDMSGNVWEWCYDKSNNILRNSRVIRGVSWYNQASWLYSDQCKDELPRSSFVTLGFRASASLVN